MATLSIVTITLNEGRNITPCLESVRWADELIVVDSGSTDTTVDLAKQVTPHVYIHPWEGYGAARNFAIAKATGDWIFWLDADERVTPELAAEIRDVLASNNETPVGYCVSRRAYFLGRWIRHSGWYPSRVTRMFRRGHAKFNETLVHEQLLIDGPVDQFRNDLIHYTDPDLDHYFSKFNRYTSLAAQDMEAAGRGFSAFDLFVRPPFLFVKMYIFRQGFRDGLHGLILAVLSSFYVFTKYAKLWEMKKK